jgi:hypothetical protein
MPQIAIASVNGGWMNDWLTGGAKPAAFKLEFFGDGEQRDTAGAVDLPAGLITAPNADVVALMGSTKPGDRAGLFIHNGGTRRDTRPTDRRPATVRITSNL